MSLDKFYLKSFEIFTMAGKAFIFQGLFLLAIFMVFYGSQKLYSFIDETSFPHGYDYVVVKDKKLSENERGIILGDALFHQMKYELNSTFGWTANGIVLNRYDMDNRSYRQIGVANATRVLLDIYSTKLAKLGDSDLEDKGLYIARSNNFSIAPTSIWFFTNPSADQNYRKGLVKILEYQNGLKSGHSVFNASTADIHAVFEAATGQELLGRALSLLQDAQAMPFWTVDNNIYEVQGICLVVRDFIKTLYALYPQLIDKNSERNMLKAIEYLDKVCAYDPIWISSSFNSGELVSSWVFFARMRLEDVKNSLRI